MKALNPVVAVDWGSSSFRAYRFDSTAEPVEKVEAPAGIKTVSNGDFEAVLFEHTGHWLHDGDAVLLSGMITSRNGWVETPYLECPVPLLHLAEKSVHKPLAGGITAMFLPGVCTHNDVMRGEELQLYGAINSDEQIVVLPGTHSKWAYVKSGVLEKFHTVVTGELFDLLINNSLVGGLASSTTRSESGFAKGVHDGFGTAAIISQLFTARAGVLLGHLDAREVHSYLSGLLIGNEISESAGMYPDVPVLLIGAESLVADYQTAFNLLEIMAKPNQCDAAASGFQKLIEQSRQ